jgi:hypothetical protein
MRTLLAIVFALALSQPAGAQSPGDRDGYGSVFENGFWVYNGEKYTRSWIATPTYTNGYYARGYWLYQKYVPLAAAPLVLSTDPQFKIKSLLEIAKNRDKYELELRRAAAEHGWFIEATKALGLENNFRIDGYGTAVSYGHYPSAVPPIGAGLTAIGTTGTTVSGYSAQQILQAYGITDVGTLFQQSAAAGKDARAYGAEATKDFASLVGQAGANQAKIAEILANAERDRARAEQVRLAMQSATLTTQQSGVTLTPTVPVQVPVANSGAPLPTGSRQVWLQSKQICAECHGGAKSNGNFSIDKYDPGDIAQKMRVLNYINPKSPKAHCPQLADGTYAPLNDVIFRAWVENQ